MRLWLLAGWVGRRVAILRAQAHRSFQRRAVGAGGFYPTPGPGAAFNPVVVDGVLYALGAGRAIVALDAATGKQIWSHPVEGSPVERGINYWESRDCADRRLTFTANSPASPSTPSASTAASTSAKASGAPEEHPQYPEQEPGPDVREPEAQGYNAFALPEKGNQK